MSNYLPATLGIAAMLIASTSLAQARSELEKSNIKAATDCVAAAALNNSQITTLYRENRLREVTNWVVLRSSACDNSLNAMRLLHDRLYGQGTGQTFLRGDYLDDLPRAVGERIKVEVLRRIVQQSNELRTGKATSWDGVAPAILPGGTATTPPPSSSSATLPGGTTPAAKPIIKGTELRVVQIGPNDVLKMRRDATDDSPVVDTIPADAKGVTYLGDSLGQWIFVQYDRSNGWVNLRFVSPVGPVGGRI
jgi:hypothetical protein